MSSSGRPGGDCKLLQFFALTSISSLPACEESESAVSRDLERGRQVGRRRREPGSLRESFTYRVLQKERRTYCIEAGGKKEGCKGGRTLLHARAAVYMYAFVCTHTHISIKDAPSWYLCIMYVL